MHAGEALLHGNLQHPHRNLRMSFRGEPLAPALAGTLRHVWRSASEPIRLEGVDLRAWADRLIAGGVGALAWWRIRQTELATEPESASLLEAFRYHAVSAARNERDLQHLLLHFNDAGIEPILFKGWSLARLYPHRGLRPFGDFDLLVTREQTERAREVLRGLPPDLRERADVDTSETLGRYLPDRSESDLFGRSSSESLDGARFRVLSWEDHLRLVALHQLHHGGWRPLWLCDVAILLEATPGDFSWERCLRGDPRLSEGVLATTALAAELLGARLPPGTPEFPVPTWLRRAVLHGWVHGYESMPSSLYELRGLGWRGAFRALRDRWPDPVSATVHLRAPFRTVPRLAVQLVECLRRTADFARRDVRWRVGVDPELATVGKGVVA
jgi:Uncharacterised nucleotidyltransferase